MNLHYPTVVGPDEWQERGIPARQGEGADEERNALAAERRPTRRGIRRRRTVMSVHNNERADVERVTVRRMDHVGIVVDDLAAATAFFVELGLELQGEGPSHAIPGTSRNRRRRLAHTATGRGV